MTKPKIELGQKWKTRGGEIVTIVENTGHNLYPWCAGDGESYTDSGLYRSVRTDDRDLMELIEDTPVKKPTKPALSVGQKWKTRVGEVVTITSRDDHEYWPWNTDDGASYTEDGYEHSNTKPNMSDLMELIEDATVKSALDIQISGSHYRDMAIQPWQAIDAWMNEEQMIGYYVGTAVAYLARINAEGAGKGGVVDIRKAHHTLSKLIETLDAKESQK